MVPAVFPIGVPYTEMAQVAAQFPAPAGPTSLYLNFDGRSNRQVSSFFGSTGNVTRDIQEILFRASQIFAPFNVEVKRVYGNGNFGPGNESTTLFIGDKLSNTSIYDTPDSGQYVVNGTRGVADADYPSIGSGIFHIPNSDPVNAGYVDPYSYSGLDDDFTPANYTSWDNAAIARVIAHEAGHTFGLAHVLTGGQPEVMSYDAANTRFRNLSYNVTNLNSVPGGGPAVPSPSLQPYWSYYLQIGNGQLLVPSPILTQNSYQTLMANLGPRAVDGYANVADTGLVDGSYIDGVQTVLNLNSALPGEITISDHDVFRFTIGATDFVEVTVNPTPGSQLDPVLLVMDQDGKRLVTYDNDSGPGTASRLVFQALAGTTYHLVVAGDDGLSSGGYSILASAATFPVNPQNLPGNFAEPSINRSTETTIPRSINQDGRIFVLPGTAPPKTLQVIDASTQVNRSGQTIRLRISAANNKGRLSGTPQVRVFTAGRDGIPNTRDDRTVAIRSVRLVAADNSIVVTLASALPKSGPGYLTLSGLTSTTGNVLDGDFNGKAGGRYTARIEGGRVESLGLRRLVDLIP
jgi:hypothetical protein